MAHFAFVSEQGRVENVVVVSNDAILDEYGNESEAVGAAFCNKHIKAGLWVQTSLNTRNGIHYSYETGLPDGGRPIRHNYAQVGGLYLSRLDIFVGPAPADWYQLSEAGEWYVPFGIDPQTGIALNATQLDWVLTVGAAPKVLWV